MNPESCPARTCQLKLVFLPGMDGTGELFSGFIAALPEAFDIVVVSYPREQYLPYSELENLVRAACPTSEPFMLIAESFSTPLALMYAATNPANLRGVVLCAGFARSPVRGWRQIIASLLAPFVFRLPLPDLVARRWLVGAGASSSLLSAVRATISSVQPSVLTARLRGLLATDVSAWVARIQAPILYIRAKQDRLVSVMSLEELWQIKPHMEVAVVEGPHLLLQREPYSAAQVVVRFVRN